MHRVGILKNLDLFSKLTSDYPFPSKIFKIIVNNQKYLKVRQRPYKGNYFRFN